jgi:hypothetical protein
MTTAKHDFFSSRILRNAPNQEGSGQKMSFGKEPSTPPSTAAGSHQTAARNQTYNRQQTGGAARPETNQFARVCSVLKKILNLEKKSEFFIEFEEKIFCSFPLRKAVRCRI